MASNPSEARSNPTFAAAMVAPHPRVVPLYATSIPHNLNVNRRKHSIHKNLPSKVRYQPYSTSPSIVILRSESAHQSAHLPISVDIAPIIIPRPHSSTTVANAGWNAARIKLYRRTAREAVKLYLDIVQPLGDQHPEAHEKACDMIEESFIKFKNYEDHWGADVLLRDQLKSVKDTEKKRHA